MYMHILWYNTCLYIIYISYDHTFLLHKNINMYLVERGAIQSWCLRNAGNVATSQFPVRKAYDYMDVSENNGTPKSSILIGFSMINHPFGVPPFKETPIYCRFPRSKPWAVSKDIFTTSRGFVDFHDLQKKRPFLKPNGFTPLKFNMEPEKKSLEKEVPLGNHQFQVPY